MSQFQSLVILVLACLTCFIPQSARAGEGRLVSSTVRSAALGGNLLGDAVDRSVIVYLPPSYDSTPTKRYPVVYLLHGNNQRNTVWTDGRFQGLNIKTAMDTSVAAGTIREMILVMQARSASRPGEPTGTIPALRATVTGLRFFESPQRPTRKHYDDIFFYNAARYIYWELTLSHPALGRQTSFAVEDIWHGPGGDIVHRGSRVFALEGDWTDSFVFAGARKVGTITVDNPVASIPDPACLERNADRRRRNEPEVSCPAVGHGSVDLERWGRGVYQVDILVDKQTVATGRFAMWEKDEIYGEVEEKTRDRASPAGGIAAVNAKVASLRFFETGVDVLPQRDRRYGTRFPLMTAHNVGWELNLSHAVTRQWLPLPIEALLYVTDGQGQRVMQRRVMQSAVPAGWPNTSHVGLFAWDDDYYYQRAGNGRSPGKWLPGSYRVDLYVHNRKIASGAFEVAR